jgi:hypothetical protein
MDVDAKTRGKTKLTRGLMRCISAASTSAQLMQKPFRT